MCIAARLGASEMPERVQKAQESSAARCSKHDALLQERAGLAGSHHNTHYAAGTPAPGVKEAERAAAYQQLRHDTCTCWSHGGMGIGAGEGSSPSQCCCSSRWSASAACATSDV